MLYAGNGVGADTAELGDCGFYHKRSVLNQKKDYTGFRINRFGKMYSCFMPVSL